MRYRAKHLFISFLFHLLLFVYFIFIFVICLCVCHVCDMSKEASRELDPLDQETVINHQVWVLETKRVISGKTASALNH